MARKPSVDVGKVLEMLQGGMTTAAVAEHFAVSRQAVDLHRRKFILQGLITEERAPHGRTKERSVAAASSNVNVNANANESVFPAGEVPVAAPTRVNEYSVGAAAAKPPRNAKTAPPVPLDKLIELVIEAFESLKRLPALETELSQCKQEFEQAQDKIRQLEEEVNKRREMEARWEQASTRMSSDLPPDNMWKKLY